MFSLRQVLRGSAAPRPWQLPALAVLAVSHPIASVLVQGPEFFVAHDLGRLDMAVLGAGLFAGIPLACWGAAAGAAWLHPAIGRAVARLLFTLLAAALALLALKRSPVPESLLVAAALTAGIGALWAYGRSPAVRLFVSALAPAPLVAAAVFFLSTPVAAMMRSVEARVAGGPERPVPPVVMIVFDQLPLMSLLDDTRRIDRRRFPNFAALADVSTWYRNTTAAATLTNWAVPAILTGRQPQTDLLPSAVDHPESLFSLLAGTHAFHVEEPLTALCPPSLCVRDGAVWTTLGADLAVVYAHVVLPSGEAARLPAVASTWHGFGFWQGRWNEQRDDDRRGSVLAWIDGIDRGERPGLHVLHALLPHEPYVYLPSGQMGAFSGTPPPGLDQHATWTDDARLVALNYQQHLRQVQFVDRLLGLAIDRLKQTGQFDESLIVVAADHGAAFRPGRPFKQPVDSTLAEIAAIPFLMKPPGSAQGAIVDRPLQAIDVLPTMARELGIEIPWAVDGHPAQAADAPWPDVRRLYRDRAERYVDFDAELFERSILAAEQRKAEALPDDPAQLGWAADPVRHLVGRPAASLPHLAEPRLIATLDGLATFERVDPDGEYVPGYVSGSVRAGDGSAGGVRLALSVNGVIRATAEVATRPVGGRPGFWAALLPADSYERGANDIRLYEISARPPLRLRAVALQRSTAPNLLQPAIQASWGITERGFHAMEWSGATPFRWTDGAARLTVPFPAGERPSELEVLVVMAAAPDQRLEITMNDCTLDDGPATEPATKRLPLAACGDPGGAATFAFLSSTTVPSDADPRALGVAIASVRLR